MGVDQIKEWLSLVWPLGIGVFILVNFKGLVKGLKGNDDEWNMSDIAKGMIIAMLWYILVKDGNRDHEWRYFTESIYFILMLGLFGLAQLKEIISDVVKIITGITNNIVKKKNDEQTETP